MTDDSPFAEVPSGIDLAHYFMEGTDRRNRGCDGIGLWRDGQNYCYLWVEAMVDQDMWVSYLLDIRTNRRGEQTTEEFTETRDFLFVHAGAGGVFEVEWHNHPIRFDAPTEQHVDRLNDGLKWFVDRVVGTAERHLEGYR